MKKFQEFQQEWTRFQKRMAAKLGKVGYILVLTTRFAIFSLELNLLSSICPPPPSHPCHPYSQPEDKLVVARVDQHRALLEEAAVVDLALPDHRMFGPEVRFSLPCFFLTHFRYFF